MSSQTEDKKKAELRKKIEYQVACEEKAFRIVERLIENPVEQDWFIDSLHFITPNHYEDVIEERAVSKLCGYPLCPNHMGKVPSQKYFISTRSNKVYDIEGRKNFCNSRCYKASKHIEKQISSMPVWSRKNEPKKKYELLPLDMKVGILGDEVQVSAMDDMRTELKKLEKLDHYQRSREDMEHSIRQDMAHSSRVDDEHSSRKDIDNSNRKLKDVRDRADHDGPGSECVYSLDKALSEMGIDGGVLESEKTAETSEDKPKVVKPDKDEVKAFVRSSEDIEDSAGAKKGGDSTGKEHRVKHKSDKSRQQAKTEYLMKLLDRKKSLLAKMADIQPVSTEAASQDSQSVKEKAGDMTEDSVHESHGENVNKDTDKAKVTGKTIEEIVNEECDKAKVKGSAQGENVNVVGDKAKVNRSAVEKVSATAVEERSNKQENAKKAVNITVLHMICKNLKSWITKETVKYLKSKEEGRGEPRTDRSGFEKQYRALVAKVDAQEREFSDLIGEESMEGDMEDQAKAPAPHFEVLRQEVSQNQLRVREFMKGTFTYKVDSQEAPKEDRNQKEIVLPTVDKYDQMLIRQRIVLDRINSVLPNLLSPLNLPVGDVFTDIRELTKTFNLTSDNILFRPAEWTVVTLILLKMLTRKHANLAAAFSIPSAEKYVNTLLSGIKTDRDTLDQQVEMLTT